MGWREDLQMTCPWPRPMRLGYFRAAGYELLTVTADYAAGVAALPSLHRDPFDRILMRRPCMSRRDL